MAQGHDRGAAGVATGALAPLAKFVRYYRTQLAHYAKRAVYRCMT